MKKLILSLLLLIPSISFADTATTGNPALILVSTGSVDRTRSWGDKINENFSIISASMAAIIAGGVISGGSQSSFAGSKATGAVEMNGFSINNSSGFTLGTGGYITFPDGTTMSSSSGSGVSRIIAGTNITISPADGRGEVTINSSGGGSGGCEDMWDLNLSGDLNPALNPTDGSGCSGSTNPLVIYQDEVVISSPTYQINFKGSGVSVSQSGSTATVTITSGGSGGVADGSNAGDLFEYDDGGNLTPTLVTFANDFNCDLDNKNWIMFKPNVGSAFASANVSGVWFLEDGSYSPN